MVNGIKNTSNIKKNKFIFFIIWTLSNPIEFLF